MSTTQYLADCLVAATEEQDVLRVMKVLEQMKEQKCSEKAINGKHSSKAFSALGSIILSPFTPNRKIILEILLLEGVDDESDDVIDIFMDHENEEVMQLLLNWETGGREKDAVHLLVLPMEKSAAWIKSNLAAPSPPHQHSFVSRPPPVQLQPTATREETAPDSTSEYLENVSPLQNTNSSLEVVDHERNGSEYEEGEVISLTTEVVETEVSTLQQPKLPRSPISLSTMEPILEQDPSPSSSFLANSSDLTGRPPSRCGPSLLAISDSLPPESAIQLEPETCAILPRPLPVPPIQLAASPPLEGSHSLLLVNLPLYGTPESLAFLTNFPFFVEIIQIPDRNQSVGVLQIDSAAEASALKKKWNGHTVNGAKVKVVHGTAKLKGKEAVDHYFANEDEIARAFTRDVGKRRRLV